MNHSYEQTVVIGWDNILRRKFTMQYAMEGTT